MIVTIGTPAVSVSVNPGSVNAELGLPVVKEYPEIPVYDGPLSVTPSGEAQTLQTKNLRVMADITIDPIPQNYGLITWNGSFLTVS